MAPPLPRTALLPLLLLAPSAALLLAEPCSWLVTTWLDPSWDSSGEWVALGVVALALRSLASGEAAARPGRARLVLATFAATALVRLAGQVLAIRLVGALALAVDVWAIGVALRLADRPRPVDPRWLAALFCFSLPLEQVLQRVAGFPLRQAASALAGGLLAPLYPLLERRGTLLLHPDLQLSVDLPCSGAQGLVLLGVLGCALAVTRRPGPLGLAALVHAVPAAALIANTVRIVALFVAARAGLPALQEPLHSAIGLLALTLGAAPLLLLARRWQGRRPPSAPSPSPLDAPARPLRPRHALLAAALAAAVALAPGHPLDVAAPSRGARLPSSLDGWVGEELPLSPREEAYFSQYGGGVARRTYSVAGQPFVALVVRTTAPLRHLHGPDRCLVGAGHRVERLGVEGGGLPTVVWRSTDPDGVAWRVRTLFVSDRGETAATVSEVVWRWLGDPAATWSMVERVSPWSACELDPSRCEAFDAALSAALDLPTSPLESS